MIIKTLDGRVIAEAETLADIKKLMSLGEVINGAVNAVKRTYKKRPTTKKDCVLCGKTYRGRQGLVQHQRFIHPREFNANGKHAIVDREAPNGENWVAINND